MNIDKIISQTSQEDLILFLEIVALLHDIGKLSMAFISSKAIDNQQEDTHALLPLTDNFPEIFQKSITIFLNYNKLKSFEFNPFTLICSHHGCERCPKVCPFKQKNPLITLLRLADQKTSEEEKGFLLDNSRQAKDKTYFSTPLGQESLVITGIIDELRDLLWKKINKEFEKDNIREIRNQIFKEVKIVFTCYPSETRRPGNDLSLWDHSFITATYFKIALYELLIKGINILPSQKIPVVFLKIKNSEATLRESIETRYCAGNLVLSIAGYHIYAVAKSFLSEVTIPESKISESFFSLIPDLKEVVENLKSDNATSVFLPDYRSLFQLIAESSFTHPITKDSLIEAETILNKVITWNCLREKKETEERIESISRHLANLEKGGFIDNKKSEYLLKTEEIKKLKTDLNLISWMSDLFKVNEESSLRPTFSYPEIPIIQLYRDWSKTPMGLTFKEYALYYLFQRKPSLSSCSSLLREIEKLLTEIKDFFLAKDYHCWDKEGILYLKEPLSKDLLLEVKKIINRFSGNNIGLVPIYRHKIGKKIPLTTKPKNHFHKVLDWRWFFSIGQRFLLFKFKKKEEPMMISIDITDNNLNYYRFYRQKNNQRFVHLSEVKPKDSILWYFPLEPD